MDRAQKKMIIRGRNIGPHFFPQHGQLNKFYLLVSSYRLCLYAARCLCTS